MDEQQHDALLERAGSAETMTVPRSNSNMKAFKVAGLTVLACLLLAGQAMTAYFILGQKDHLSALEKGQENLKKELTRRVSASPKMMHMPMNSMPMLQALDVDDDSPKPEAKPEGKKDTIMSTRFISQREGSGIPDGSRLGFRRPQMSMQSLPLLFDENATETPAMKIEGKCELDAKKGVKPGFYAPQCDEQGHYLPKQCWHSTGYCWCVDKNGEKIEGTLTRGPLECGGDGTTAVNE